MFIIIITMLMLGIWIARITVSRNQVVAIATLLN